MTYADLELSLQRHGDAYAVELRFQPDPDSPVAHLLGGEPPLARFAAERLAEHTLDVAAYGAYLGSMLFADPVVRAAFATARQHAEAAGLPLRLRLRLDADDGPLHALRWETLCDPDAGGFLCASERLLVSRYLDSADLSPLELRPRAALRALVAVANPAGLEQYPGLASVDVPGEIARSRAALEGIPITILGRGAGDTPATLDAIVEALRGGPDLLYLVAHGSMLDGESFLWLESETGGIQRASGGELAERICALADRPCCIVLASCQSAGTSQAADALVALGPRLASAGIPAVLAMQGLVTMETVAAMMPLFFRELQRDGRIDRALAAARASVLERPDWWMPVLFLRSPDGMLWRDPEPAALPAAPPPERPPETSAFVGREAELAAFTQRLAAEHVVEITGMPGVGKTALAAVLAARVAPSERVFWHSFHSGQGGDTLIWALAAFLAQHDQPDVWVLLQRSRQGEGQTPPFDLLLDYLVPLLDGHGFLLCLDDFHYVDDDPQLDELVQRLRPLLAAGALDLVITSRRAPSFAILSEVELLTGLTRADARLLAEARGLSLPEPLFEQLYAQTGGNAQLLTLAINALRRARSPERLVTDLIDADDIVRYLMHEVDAGLSDDERLVMRACSALLDRGGTRGAIKALCDGVSVRATLLALVERYLLSGVEGPAGKEYRLHAMVQAFFYDDLDREERETLHRRAAFYYGAEDHDSLYAALHFERAGDDAQAVDVATAATTPLINGGQAGPLRQLLERFVARQHEPADPRRLDPERWIAVNLACGEVYARLRERDLACEQYQTAFELLTTMPDSPARRERIVAVCRGMAEVLEYEAPQEALVWLRRGKEAAQSSSSQQQGTLLLREGSALIATGQLEAAATALEQSLRLLPHGAALWRGKAHLNLGVVACIRGDLQGGKAQFLQAEQLLAQAQSDWDLATVWQNLGRVQALTGDWPGAIATYRRALELAVRLGNGTRQAALEYCLGVLATSQGQVEQARAHLATSLGLARAQHLREYIVSALAALADLHVRLEEWEAAAGALAEAEPLALAMEANDQLPELYRLSALLKLGQGDPRAALTSAERALALAHTLGDPLAQGSSLRAQAQALLALERGDDAFDAFARSAALLDPTDRFEAARTRAQWGAALLERGNRSRGTALIDEALAVFVALGAQREQVAAATLRATAGQP